LINGKSAAFPATQPHLPATQLQLMAMPLRLMAMGLQRAGNTDAVRPE
jgi:hypothetical protein